MRKRKKPAATPARDLPRPGKQYPGVHGKIVDWAEHVFEEGMMYVRRLQRPAQFRLVREAHSHVLRESEVQGGYTEE
jgi:hypothetical protein